MKSASRRSCSAPVSYSLGRQMHLGTEPPARGYTTLDIDSSERWWSQREAAARAVVFCASSHFESSNSCEGGVGVDKRGARFGTIVALVAVVFSLRSAPAGAQAVPKQLRIAVGIDADTLDPAGQTTTTVANMVDYVYETLVRADYAAGKVAPQLATSWTVSRDGLTYLFRLREGVTFQDGTPFVAEPVTFTFDRLLDLKTRVPLRFLVGAVKEGQGLDPSTR